MPPDAAGPSASPPPGGRGPLRAAQYLRMSHDTQTYSLESQATTLAAYAAARGYEIVRTYCDEAISGVGIRNRRALQSLLADVLSGQADFDVVLTYDVSRWGRFQDPDQAAHYEYVCREAGVSVEYCAETFENDGTLATTILKNIRRGMAGEFSRDLSSRVRRVQALMARDGYWVGGPAGYGLRRQVVERDGSPGMVMEFGQRKALQGQRVILVPGPPEEVAVVRRIYRQSAGGTRTFSDIARALNQEGVCAEGGARWTTNRVRQVLSNEKYIGVNVFGRMRNRLGERPSRQPRDRWVTAADAFEPLVSRRQFARVQAGLKFNPVLDSDANLLAKLAALLAREGRLTGKLINAAPSIPCSQTYSSRFGTLLNAYRLVGYEPTVRQLTCAATRGLPRRTRRARQCLMSDAALRAGLARLLAREGRLSVQLINDDAGLPSSGVVINRLGGLAEAYRQVGYQPSEFQLQAMVPHAVRRRVARGHHSPGPVRD